MDCCFCTGKRTHAARQKLPHGRAEHLTDAFHFESLRQEQGRQTLKIRFYATVAFRRSCIVVTQMHELLSQRSSSGHPGIVKSSTCIPTTRPNSRLLETRISPCVRAMAAIIKSFGPIVWPCDSDRSTFQRLTSKAAFSSFEVSCWIAIGVSIDAGRAFSIR